MLGAGAGAGPERDAQRGAGPGALGGVLIAARAGPGSRPPSPGPGPTAADKASYLSAKVRKLEQGRWDGAQLLYELVGSESRCARFVACASEMGAPGGWRVLDALLPALAEREVLDALNQALVNCVLTELVHGDGR